MNFPFKFVILPFKNNEIPFEIDEIQLKIDEIPFTGWPTDRVFSELVTRMDSRQGVFIIVLDEIYHLVRKVGDDLLYNLTKM